MRRKRDALSVYEMNKSKAFEALSELGVKQYWVEFIPKDNGSHIKIHRRAREIPYLDIARRYPMSEIDLKGKDEVKSRNQDKTVIHATDNSSTDDTVKQDVSDNPPKMYAKPEEKDDIAPIVDKIPVDKDKQV